MGLEALEPPLAELLGVSSGSEEVTGKCASCGVEYTRNRTVLNGVRAYIRGAKHPDPASSAEREKEWKQINKLRQDIFHSLEDVGKIRAKSYDVLVAAARHLHDAICCLSHTHDLESQTYRMRRGAQQLLSQGHHRTWHPRHARRMSSGPHRKGKRMGPTPRTRIRPSLPYPARRQARSGRRQLVLVAQAARSRNPSRSRPSEFRITESTKLTSRVNR
jgi:hypothetical protein